METSQHLPGFGAGFLANNFLYSPILRHEGGNQDNLTSDGQEKGPSKNFDHKGMDDAGIRCDVVDHVNDTCPASTVSQVECGCC